MIFLSKEVMEEIINLQPLEWQFEETNRLTIYLWGFDQNSNPHLVRFPDFPATCEIQLPDFVDGKPFQWTDDAMNDFVNFILFRRPAYAPFDYCPHLGKQLYYYQGDQKTQFITLYFHTLSSMWKCINLFRYGSGKTKEFRFKNKHSDYGTMSVNVWETKIPIVRKLLTAQNCNFNGWLQITGTHPLSRDDLEENNEGDVVVVEKDIMGNVIQHDTRQVFFQKSTFPKVREWVSNWRTLTMSAPEYKEFTVKPKLMGYDIEAYSDNHRIFPNKLNHAHCVFMISCVVQRAFEPETRVRYAIVFGRSNEIPQERLENCHIIEVDSEMDTILEFGRIMREQDPDLVLGYNILGFDYLYLNGRLGINLEQWPFMGRMPGNPTYLKSQNWSSGGYGFNSINELIMDGRVSVDMLPVIKRSKKLLRYNLDTVATEVLGRTKHDVTPTEMFLTFERQQETLDDYNEAIKTLPNMDAEMTDRFGRVIEDRLKFANDGLELISEELEKGKYIDKYVEGDLVPTAEFNDPSKGGIYNRHGKVNWCSTQLWELLCQIATDSIASMGNFPKEWGTINPEILGRYQAGVFIMTRVTYYCLIDSDLCIDLFEKENTWHSLTSMSEIAGVSIRDIMTRGQQIRTLSLIYDYAKKEGIVLTERDAPEIVFAGGFVFDVVPNKYDRVAVVDFNSLYPSIMDTYNVCYTTLVRPEHFDHFTTPQMIENVHVVKVPIPKDDDDYDLEDDDVNDIALETLANDDEGDQPKRKAMTANQKRAAIRRAHNGIRIDEEGKNYIHLYVKRPDCPECTACDDCNYIQEGRKNHKGCEGCPECMLSCVGPFDEDIAPPGNWPDLPGKCKGCKVCKRPRRTHCPDHVECCVKYNEAPNRRRGLIPKIVTALLDRRAAVRKLIPTYPKGHHMRIVFDGCQLALKVTANSVYGFLGVPRGKLPLLEGSVSITALGRGLTTSVADYVQTVHKLYVVYGDTDSVMFQLKELDPKLFNKIGRSLAAEISKCFIGILNLELEKVMKGVYICKKKYIGYVYTNDGTFLIDPTTKRPFLLIRGVVLARRDNARWLRNVYLELIHMILGENGTESTFIETMRYLVGEIKKLMSGQVHFEELVTVRGIGIYYKNDKYFMKMFADNLARKGKPAKPGERLGYIIHTPTNEMEEKYIGNRMILPEDYIESQDTTNPYHIDYLYYLEKQFQVTLDQIMWCTFNTEINAYTDIKFRPSKRCRFTGIQQPVKMMVRMIKAGHNIDKIVQSLEAIDNLDPRGPLLCQENEINNYEYPLIPERKIRIQVIPNHQDDRAKNTRRITIRRGPTNEKVENIPQAIKIFT